MLTLRSHDQTKQQMNTHGVWQDSDTETPDPNLPETFEAKRVARQRMEQEDDDIYGDARSSAVFRFLDASNPARARRRIGTLYWKAWKRVLMSFFMSAFGLTFTIVGVCCMMMCDEPGRGVGFLVCGLLVLLPGVYGAVTLVAYVRGMKNVHYRSLPEMD